MWFCRVNSTLWQLASTIEKRTFGEDWKDDVQTDTDALFETLIQWRAAGEAAALATVVRTWGSSPRAEGRLSGADSLFARTYVPAPRLLIVGAVHIAQALSQMAEAAGFEVVVIDPRGAFASAERFPGVQLTTEWPDEAPARLGLDEAMALVALSHDPKLDDPALELALPSPVFYIGALGSRRTHVKRLERLRTLGLDPLLDRIHSPIGLDLGGRSPAEIAVAILAELILARYRGDST